LSVEASQERSTALAVTPVARRFFGWDGATWSPALRVGTSSRSKLTSPEPLRLCTSTAMVLVPLASTPTGTDWLRYPFSAAPDTSVEAVVWYVMAPAGMFERITSTPLM
jgi:hypothetical protein